MSNKKDPYIEITTGDIVADIVDEVMSGNPDRPVMICINPDTGRVLDQPAWMTVLAENDWKPMFIGQFIETKESDIDPDELEWFSQEVIGEFE